MPPRSDKACDVVVLKAVKDAHTRAGRNFQHKCNIARNAMNATQTPGARFNHSTIVTFRMILQSQHSLMKKKHTVSVPI